MAGRGRPNPVAAGEALESRLLLHAGHDHGADEGQALPAWHADEHYLAALSSATAAPTAPSVIASSDPAIEGQWDSTVLSWPAVAIHSHVLPTGKVLFWGADGDAVDDAHTWLWDPVTNAIIDAADPGYDAFCAGHSFLADGRLLVTGGNAGYALGVAYASIYDPFTDTWTRQPDMNLGRWYPTSTTLGNGDVVVSGGNHGGPNAPNTLPQVWQADGSGWRDLTTALRAQNLFYPRSFLTPSGKVFDAGPLRPTAMLDPAGTGQWTNGPGSNFGYRQYGSAVMYAEGKILIVGGAGQDFGGPAPTASAEVIDLNAAAPAWRYVNPMSVGRRQHNATILPDGNVLVTGGVGGAGFNERGTAVYSAEMWDPATEQFTPMASMTQPRWYHSTALLLPDGRVLSAGGDDTPTAEIYSPPYLFRGPRPTIADAPDHAAWGESFVAATPDAADVASVTLVRMGSATHAFDYDQRILRPAFAVTQDGLTVTAPASPNLAPPGYYMLFLVSADGVPSVAKVMRIGADPAAPSAPDLVPASDTGSSDADDVTADATPTFTGTAPAGSTVKLFAGGVRVGIAAAGPDGAYEVTASALADGAHTITATATLSGMTGPASGGLVVTIDTTPAAVTGRYVFYNNSAFDAAGGDDAAVAVNKDALLPGGTATFANYTSYSKGVNGLMVDIAGLRAAGLSAGDFAFAAGNSDTPDLWDVAPAPDGFNVRRGEGAGGSGRVTLTWPDGAIKETWLRVTVKANQNTGLAAPDVFYFGNAPGESGNWATAALVNSVDEMAARHRARGASNPAPVDFRWDYNRDRRVDARDWLVVRANRTDAATALRLITVPAPDAPSASAATAFPPRPAPTPFFGAAPAFARPRRLDEVADLIDG